MDFASELNTNVGAYEILLMLTEDENFSMFEQKDMNFELKLYCYSVLQILAIIELSSYIFYLF